MEEAAWSLEFSLIGVRSGTGIGGFAATMVFYFCSLWKFVYIGGLMPGRLLLALLDLDSGSSILKSSIEIGFFTDLKGSLPDLLVMLKFSAWRIIESGMFCERMSELITSFEYCISLLNSSKFFPNIRTTLFFACIACFMSLSSLSRSLVVDPIIEPGPLPLRTLPAFILEAFMSLSCIDGLHLVPLDDVIPAPYAEIDCDVNTDSFVPPVAMFALLEEC